MSAPPKLPPEFSDLEAFTERWLLDNEADRLNVLVATSVEDLRPFYEAMAPRAEAAIAYLDGLDLDALPAQAKNLFHLLMTFVETAHPIELGWTITDIDDPFPLETVRWGPPSATSPLG